MIGNPPTRRLARTQGAGKPSLACRDRLSPERGKDAASRPQEPPFRVEHSRAAH